MKPVTLNHPFHKPLRNRIKGYGKSAQKKPKNWCKGLVWLILCLIITGCAPGNSNQASAFEPDQYPAILPYQGGEISSKHVGLISDQDTRFEMEIGLMNLSKKHFSPREVGYTSHTFLTFDELDASDGSRGLLGRERDDNPNGLNPASDALFDTGNGISTGPVLLIDVYELDFYHSNVLRGISLGLIVNDQAEVNGQDVDIEPEMMKGYISSVFNQLTSYLRLRFDEISMETPIYLAAYQLNTSSEDINGGFIMEGWYPNSQGAITELKEQTILVPSEEFSVLDQEKALQFVQFKADVQSVIPDLSYVMAEAFFEGGQCKTLTITINSYGKTAGEVLAVIQNARDKLSTFTDTDCSYLVLIYNNTEIMALLNRQSGQSKVQTAMTLYT